MTKRGRPKKHHYVPQFYLRLFASDTEKKRITSVQKHGNMADWAERRIKSIGFETDLYIHEVNGAPVCVEDKINQNIETPISASDTWRKISTGNVDDLDQSDRFVLYSLVRHLEVRSPNFRTTINELTTLAADPGLKMNFSSEESEMYLELRSTPGLATELANLAASSPNWAINEFYSCRISVVRTHEPVYTTSKPVLAIKSPDNPQLRSTQLGYSPYSSLLPISPNAYVILSLGDFDGGFTNTIADYAVEAALKRQVVHQFGYLPIVKHLICGSEDIIEQMEWAKYKATKKTPLKISFERQTEGNVPIHKSPERT